MSKYKSKIIMAPKVKTDHVHKVEHGQGGHNTEHKTSDRVKDRFSYGMYRDR